MRAAPIVLALLAATALLPMMPEAEAATCQPPTAVATLPSTNYGWAERHSAVFSGPGAPANTESFAVVRHPDTARSEDTRVSQGPGLYRQLGQNGPHPSPYQETVYYPSFGTPFGFQVVAIDPSGALVTLTVRVHNAATGLSTGWPVIHPGGLPNVALAGSFGGIPPTTDYVELQARSPTGTVITSTTLFSLVPFTVATEDVFAGLLTFDASRLDPDHALVGATLQAAHFGRNTRAVTLASMRVDPPTTADPTVAAAAFADTGDGLLDRVPVGTSAGSDGGFLVAPVPRVLPDLQGAVDDERDRYALAYRISEKWAPAATAFRYLQTTSLSARYRLPVEVRVDPETMNRASAGRYVTAYVELWSGCDPSLLDASATTLNGVPAATGKGFATAIADEDGDGIPERILKFDRAAVLATLGAGEDAVLRLRGALTDGSPLRGSDVNRQVG